MSQKEAFTKVSIIAHRGASSLAPENTLMAAEAALSAGADMWELDVRLTADGQPVLAHDEHLTDKTDVHQHFPEKSTPLVSDLTLTQLRTLDFGSWFVQQDPYGLIKAGTIPTQTVDSMRGLQINTLREALEWTKAHNWRVNVELKEQHTPHKKLDLSIVHKTIDLFEELRMLDNIIVSSFCVEYLRLCRARSPQLALGWLVSEHVPDPAPQLRALDAQAYHPLWTQLTPLEIQNALGTGAQINVWTLDDLKDAQALIALGVNGIITNTPQDFR